MNRYYLLFACFCVFMLSACVPKSIKRTPYLNKIVQAKSNTGQRAQSILLATERFIQSGEINAAKSNIDSISTASLSAQQRNKFNLLYAQVHLSNGEAELALNKLSVTQPYKLKQNDQITYYQSLAFAYSLTGDLKQSAHARIQLDSILETDQQRKENNSAIFETLNLLSVQTLILEQPPAPDILGGWMALTRLIKMSKQSPTEFQNNLYEWQHFFPNHPANSSFLQSYFKKSIITDELPAAIALLLPESGRFSKAAQVIKEGFMEAYHNSESDFQPPLRFYDSSVNNPVSLYHQAVSEGAKLVIGPLSKDNIQNLALSTELTIPVLALNHVPNLVQDNLLQFGLSPIDEAKQVSAMAALDGNVNALLLVPDTTQGQRIANYLIDSWEEIGGRLLESQSYNPRKSDFSRSIKKLLNLDESRYRFNHLKRVLVKNVEFTERRRQDIDAIFLSASVKKARSLYPQIRFYHASRVPVYAMPNIYSGQPNPSLDIDLNSIIFCDLPWLFPDAYPWELNQEAIRHIWQQHPTGHLRLLALGIDSFNIIPHLSELASTSYPGATGTLSLNMENRITRQLACAKFVNGKPVLQYYNDEQQH